MRRADGSWLKRHREIILAPAAVTLVAVVGKADRGAGAATAGAGVDENATVARLLRRSSSAQSIPHIDTSVF